MRRWTSRFSGFHPPPRPRSAAQRIRLLACSAALLSLAAFIPACGRSEAKLEGVERIAYSAKPAVVRVNALATAEFRYPVGAVTEIARNLGTGALNLPAGNESLGSLETGTGGSGSGFIVHSDGTILTSAHVVAATRDRKAVESDLRENGSIAALLRHLPVEVLRDLHRRGDLDGIVSGLASKGGLRNVTITNEVELSNGERHPFTIKGFSPPLHQKGTDVAVLEIKRQNLPTLELGDSEAVQVGQSVWAIGYPAVASSTDEVIGGWLARESDLEATVIPGIITAIKRNTANTPVFQSNVAIYHGNSGGPVVSQDAKVVAISTWGHTTAEQIRFLVPVNVANKMLSQAGVRANEPGSFDRSYRTALDEAGKGNWTVARRELGAASVFFQNSPDLLRLRSEAERAIEAKPFWLHPAVAAGAVAIVILPLITLLIRRVRSPARTALAGSGMKGDVSFTISPAPRGASEGLTEAVPLAGSSESILGKLTILNGERAGEKLGLGGSGIRIGRESSMCEIVLQNPKVSRLHAEIVSLDGKVLLIDRNSSNGTYVNDRRIDRQVLQDGDIIYFGGRNAVAAAFHA